MLETVRSFYAAVASGERRGNIVLRDGVIASKGSRS
jgi:L-fucose mutarotase/ribose pyranase (RbsD/FucU family)